MRYLEKPLVFDCAGDELVGVLSRPEQLATAIGIVIVVGGPQYRAGSHRQFVQLSRALAAGGYPVLRFDYRGMGDSSGSQRTFEAVGEDIGAAATALQAACPNVSRIVLWGLCDGASASLLYWQETRDPRVAGLVLLNPWVRSEASLARTQVKHYYGQRLLQRDFWMKLLTGNLAVAESVRSLWRTVGLSLAKAEAPPERLSYQARMARAWREFGGPLLLILSGQDYVAKEFLEYAKSDPAWVGMLARPGLERIDVPEADHTFATEDCRRQVEILALHWLLRQEAEGERLPAGAPVGASVA